jgi:drug/metabolite transporter (DMT)-like permease
VLGLARKPVTMNHRQAVWAMVLASALWSTAGVVTRQLSATAGFELTFWRSAFNALSLVVLLGFLQGPKEPWAALRRGGGALWLSGACWCVMFTAFMLALTMTTVANVLVTMSVGPLFTALLARAVLGHKLAKHTWGAIGLAALGIAVMFGSGFQTADQRQLWGTAVSLAVPIAAAVNWTLLQHLNAQKGGGTDMLPAVFVGALLSAVFTLPLAWPLSAPPTDVAWLALLGLTQLAIPCLMAVAAARVLSGPEISLLGLLEVLLGVLWAWLFSGETPTTPVLLGGCVVLIALAVNEWLTLFSATKKSTQPDK